jgi:hypothetical protein
VVAAPSLPSVAFPPKEPRQLKLQDLPDRIDLKGNIHNYCFIYEFGGSRDITLPPILRWVNCHHVYAVWQGPLLVGAADELDAPHYQMRADHFLQAAQELLARGGACHLHRAFVQLV